MTLPPWLDGLRAGQVRALAKGLSWAEDQPGDGVAVRAALGPPPEAGMVVGITGSTGVGKSTLIKALCEQVLAGGARVAVLAVDPSSPFSGGALLGDRFRMVLPDVPPERLFIRSLSSRGNEGGLSRGLELGTYLVRQAGYDVVLVETTGAGQCEYNVARVADLVCVLLCEGFGDELQAMKSGLLEVADLLVVTKGERPGTIAVRRDLEEHLARSPRFELFGLAPPALVVTDAHSGLGLPELWREIQARHRDPTCRAGAARKRERLARHLKALALLDQVRGVVLGRLREPAAPEAAPAEFEATVRGWIREALEPGVNFP